MTFVGKSFHLLRNLLALFGLLCLVGGVVAAVLLLKSYQLPPRVLAMKVLEKTGLDASPLLAGMVAPDPLKPSGVRLPPYEDPAWAGPGARKGRALPPFYYSPDGRAVPGLWLGPKEVAAHVRPQGLRAVPVSTARELMQAISGAEPGDVITLAPGSYRFDTRGIGIQRAGTAEWPIQVRAEVLGQVRLELNSLEGFVVDAPFWVFENLEIEGVCKNHGACEHAFHVVGRGRGFVLRNCRVHEFNAMIKGNGLDSREGGRNFPDGALIEGNSFYNATVRDTDSPVVPIDAVGVDDWTVRENFFADYAKGRGDRISTAAFIKGNASGGVFENNLVVGEYAHAGGVRLGLSFGGGGTSKGASRHKDNTVEHTDGIMRNNVILYNSDVGIYLNKSRNTQVLNNLLFKTSGIDVRFAESTAVVKNNLLDGKIRERDGGFAQMENNLTLAGGWWGKSFADLFESPGEGRFKVVDARPLAGKGLPNEHVRFDFLNAPRKEAPDLGPFELVDGEGGCDLFALPEALK